MVLLTVACAAFIPGTHHYHSQPQMPHTKHSHHTQQPTETSFVSCTHRATRMQGIWLTQGKTLCMAFNKAQKYFQR